MAIEELDEFDGADEERSVRRARKGPAPFPVQTAAGVQTKEIKIKHQGRWIATKRWCQLPAGTIQADLPKVGVTIVPALRTHVDGLPEELYKRLPTDPPPAR